MPRFDSPQVQRHIDASSSRDLLFHLYTIRQSKANRNQQEGSPKIDPSMWRVRGFICVSCPYQNTVPVAVVVDFRVIAQTGNNCVPQFLINVVDLSL
jgi:hypothetical protein